MLLGRNASNYRFPNGSQALNIIARLPPDVWIEVELVFAEQFRVIGLPFDSAVEIGERPFLVADRPLPQVTRLVEPGRAVFSRREFGSGGEKLSREPVGFPLRARRLPMFLREREAQVLELLDALD